MKINYKAKCSSCRAGEQNVPADYYVEGKYVFRDKPAPFRGYLCNDHFDIFEEEGVATKAVCINLDVLVQNYTGFKNFNDMVKSVNYCYTPTLRIDVDPQLKIVRQAFNEKMVELGLENRA
jgi:hypothetical protein